MAHDYVVLRTHPCNDGTLTVTPLTEFPGVVIDRELGVWSHAADGLYDVPLGRCVNPDAGRYQVIGVYDLRRPDHLSRLGSDGAQFAADRDIPLLQ